MQDLIHPVAEVRSVDGEHAERFYVCDYETYKKVKRLHAAYWKACQSLARWFRWSAKLPSNRIIREYKRDVMGRRCSWVEVGKQPEPKRCGVFTSSHNVEHRWKTIPDHIPDEGIIGTYALARKPWLSQKEADEAKVAIDRLLIERLTAQLEAQEAPDTELEPVVETQSYAK